MGWPLEGLQAGGQVIPVVQQETLTSLERIVEFRGQACHVGGHIVEKARGGLVVVRNLQGRKPSSERHNGERLRGWAGGSQFRLPPLEATGTILSLRAQLENLTGRHGLL